MNAVKSLAIALGALTLASAASCRGHLPPTEPPRVEGEQGVPDTRTNDPITLGPMASEGVLPTVGGSGGTSALPIPPPAPPAGSGSGGSAGSAPN